jgi:hypothetical protein
MNLRRVLQEKSLIDVKNARDFKIKNIGGLYMEDLKLLLRRLDTGT